MDYSACRQAISNTLARTETESVSLQEALARVTAKDLFAKVPQPEFTQSLRDGYVVSDTEIDGRKMSSFSVTGLIQAGNTSTFTLKHGQACRIMTGGMIPDGGTRVFAQEECNEVNNILQMSPEALTRSATYIQNRGSQIALDEKITSKGSYLTPDLLSLLAAVGHHQIEVYRKPRVGYFCSGSELVNSAVDLQPGLKICSNRHLLEGNIKQAGGDPVYLGTLVDTADELAEIFKQIKEDNFDIVISTGGMGPGKYDLIEQCFVEAAGEIIYNRLDLIPGKNSLCGTINATLFFGLPGPPSAVRALMNCIVSPTIMEMQGAGSVYPQVIHAQLQHDLSRKRSGIMQLTAANLSFKNGSCIVQLPRDREPINCYVVFPSDILSIPAGTMVEVHRRL